MASIEARDKPDRRGPASFFPPPPSKKDILHQPQTSSVQPAPAAASAPAPAAAAPPTPAARRPSSTEAGRAADAGDLKPDDSLTEAWANFSDVDSDTGLISGAKRPHRPAGSDCSSGSSTSDASDSVDEEVLAMNDKQREYYCQQFMQLCGSATAKLTGQEAKQYFERSHLPSAELAQIWAAADADADGCLSLDEFCSAMHLVVLRRNRVPLAVCLPTVNYQRFDNAAAAAAAAATAALQTLAASETH